MFELIATALLLVFPPMIAGITLVICLKKNWLFVLRKPLDAGRTLRGKRIFGDNKTWFGLLIMSSVTATVGLVLWLTSSILQDLFIFDTFGPIILGYACVGLAYSAGELCNSAIKRQLDISPGKLPQSPYRALFATLDLIDGVLAAGILYWLLFSVPALTAFAAVVAGVGIHWLIHIKMIALGLKTE